MEMPICAVFDKKTGLYDNPFTVRHVGEAVREWDIVTKNKDTKYGKNPEDFDLMEIGSFDYTKGQFHNSVPKTLATGL